MRINTHAEVEENQRTTQRNNRQRHQRKSQQRSRKEKHPPIKANRELS